MIQNRKCIPFPPNNNDGQLNKKKLDAKSSFIGNFKLLYYFSRKHIKQKINSQNNSKRRKICSKYHHLIKPSLVGNWKDDDLKNQKIYLSHKFIR